MDSSELKARGDAAFRERDLQAALELYTAALGALTDDRELHSTLLANRSIAALQLGLLAAAQADAAAAVALRPRWGKAHLRLAQAEEARGDLGAAARSYARAAELDAELGPAVSKALAALDRRAFRQRCLAVLHHPGGTIYDVAVRPQVRVSFFSSDVCATRGAAHAPGGGGPVGTCLAVQASKFRPCAHPPCAPPCRLP